MTLERDWRRALSHSPLQYSHSTAQASDWLGCPRANYSFARLTGFGWFGAGPSSTGIGSSANNPKFEPTGSRAMLRAPLY